MLRARCNYMLATLTGMNDAEQLKEKFGVVLSAQVHVQSGTILQCCGCNAVTTVPH